MDSKLCTAMYIYIMQALHIYVYIIYISNLLYLSFTNTCKMIFGPSNRFTLLLPILCFVLSGPHTPSSLYIALSGPSISALVLFEVYFTFGFSFHIGLTNFCGRLISKEIPGDNLLHQWLITNQIKWFQLYFCLRLLTAKWSTVLKCLPVKTAHI